MESNSLRGKASLLVLAKRDNKRQSVTIALPTHHSYYNNNIKCSNSKLNCGITMNGVRWQCSPCWISGDMKMYCSLCWKK